MSTLRLHADLRIRVHEVRVALRGARPRRRVAQVPRLLEREGAEAVLRLRDARRGVDAELRPDGCGRRLLRRLLRLRLTHPGACARRLALRGYGRMQRASVLLSASAVSGLLLTGFGAAPSGAAAPQGGIFRIVFAPPEQLDTMDPARANTQASWSLLDLTCARLMTHPDRAGSRAYRTWCPKSRRRPRRHRRTERRTRSRSGGVSGSVTGSRSTPARSRERSTAR